MGKKDQLPKAKLQPGGKSPRFGGNNPESTNELTPVWSIALFDHDGPMRAFFFTVWFLGMLVFDGPDEPDRAMIEQLVKEAG